MRIKHARIAAVAAGYAALWTVLSGAEAASWIVGAPAVAAAVALHRRIPFSRVSARGALRFAALFVARSLAGGWDVARRVWWPRMPIAPGFVVHDMQSAPDDPAWPLFVASVSLMPGTLAVERRDRALVVHALDTAMPLERELRTLEAAAIAVFEPAAESS